MTGDALSECYVAALNAMSAGGPRPLLPRAQLEASEKTPEPDVGLGALAASLRLSSVNDVLRKAIHHSIAKWDVAALDELWTAGTLARSTDRRAQLYERLGISKSADTIAVFNDLFPLDTESAVVISDVFEPWYSSDVRAQRGSLYYEAYAELLARKKWNATALANLDQATTQVVERLTDPQRIEARQAKGLVVGYVQSGKTANFTGVIAKSIDAGYRLIIVLTGTIEVLRRQTQRRVDMELVGKENILRGIDPNDQEMLSHVDYQNDEDWEKKFLNFGYLPSTQNRPDIIRLTTANFDFKSLQAGITALEFEKIDRSKPLYSTVNLPQSSARIVIVKKNKQVLKKLARDLRSIRTPAHEIPTLIIDDESDQASVNTVRPAKGQQVATDRTAINLAISQLLQLLPRAQYVGYTATPFANVFIDPSDTADIFPKDFLISLQRPHGYMGVKDFHDLDTDIEEKDRNVSNSNEKAYVRNAVHYENDQDLVGQPKLQEAIDAFVLSAAIKLYRSAHSQIDYRHHTMLVHQSVQQTEHSALAEEIRTIWRTSAFSGAAGLARLKKLYDDDFRPVSAARAGEFLLPENFDKLKPHVGAAISKIMAHQDPVIIVNGDKDRPFEEVDFDKREVWRILVGGAKLSRGYTVEGLTVSFYRRRTKQADTLMQMGRWFGFREGYQDLVRLYVGRREPNGPQSTLDLYDAFEAIVRDEEAFRDQLKQYSEMVDGQPQITPKDIPPLVSQHLGWLKPSASNKMFNAELVIRRTTGVPVIPTGYPQDGASIKHNYLAVKPLMAAATNNLKLVIPATATSGRSSFSAWVGKVGSEAVLNSIGKIKWVSTDYYKPDIEFLNEARTKIDDWVVIVPQTSDANALRNLPGIGLRSIHKRKLKQHSEKLWGEPTDHKHRPAALFVAGSVSDYGDIALSAYAKPRTGSLLIYPIALNPAALKPDPEESQVILAVAWVLPTSAAVGTSRVVQFRARNNALAQQAIVPV